MLRTAPVEGASAGRNRSGPFLKRYAAMQGAGKLKVLAAAVAIFVLAVGGYLLLSGGEEGDVSSEATDPMNKPTIEVPGGEPPSDLVIDDIVEGDGTTVEDGDQVTVQYVGVSYSTGQEFDASWDRGEPFPFKLGAGQVIPGWDEGVAGMKVGGRRELTIPPDLAYGEAGSPPAIGPDETLIFVIDLLDAGDSGGGGQ